MVPHEKESWTSGVGVKGHDDRTGGLKRSCPGVGRRQACVVIRAHEQPAFYSRSGRHTGKFTRGQMETNAKCLSPSHPGNKPAPRQTACTGHARSSGLRLSSAIFFPLAAGDTGAKSHSPETFRGNHTSCQSS